MRSLEAKRLRVFLTVTSSLVVIGAAGLAGCVERKETIRIAPSGAVSINLKYSAAPGDLETPVAFPSKESGWSVDRRSEFDSEGKEKVILTSQRSFAAREALPQNFAPAGDKDAALYLQCPTTIRVEKRPDGAYMHFTRVYQPRKWAYVQYWRDRLFDDDIKKLTDKPLEELSIEEKARVVKAFAVFELFKQMELEKIAISEMGDRIGQDAWLKARALLVHRYEDMDWESFVSKFQPVPTKTAPPSGEKSDDSALSFTAQVRSAANEAVEDNEKRQKRLEVEAKRLLDEALEEARVELRTAAGLNDADVIRLRTEFARAKKQYDITDALGIHSFKIKVVMPGDVVAHNGDKIDDEDGGIIWEFDGDAFRDRPYELAVTCKLPRGANKP